MYLFIPGQSIPTTVLLEVLVRLIKRSARGVAFSASITRLFNLAFAHSMWLNAVHPSHPGGKLGEGRRPA